MWPLYFSPKYLIEAFIGIQVRVDRCSDFGESSIEAEHAVIGGSRSQRD